MYQYDIRHDKHYSVYKRTKDLNERTKETVKINSKTLSSIVNIGLKDS